MEVDLVTKTLGEFKIGTIPTAFYVPDYISKEEEEYLLDCIQKASKIKWKDVKGRKLQNWGGNPHPKGMVPVPLPEWLLKIGTRMAKENGVFDGEIPNHVLVNEYHAGGGIMPHTDGPLYKPHFGILSLSSPLIMDFYPSRTQLELESTASTEPTFSLVLQPRSLLVVKDELYSNYLHGIAFRDKDIVDDKVINCELAGVTKGTEIIRTQRISLTIRVVNKVLKNIIKI